jgi:hypothetical protein
MSGVEIATAWVRIVPTVEGIQGAIASEFGAVSDAAASEGEKAGSTFGSEFSTGAKIAITAASAFLVKQVGDIFNTGLEEIKFGEQVSAQTQVLLSNTGFAMAVEQIEDYTLALSAVSGVSEESLQQAGNAVLRFGNISEENYLRAVDSINDMAASGKDAASVGELLGKALADPATAASMLRRQGVLLNEEQKAMIENFVAAGDQAGAQQVILDQLEATYGGMAEQMGGTLAGSMDKLNNQWENMAGTVVAGLVPALTGFMDVISGVITFMQGNPSVLTAVAVAVGVLTVAIIAANVAMWAMAMTPLVLFIMAIVIGIGLWVAAIVWLVLEWDNVMAWISDSWNGFVSWLTDSLEALASWWGDVWSGIVGFFEDMWQGLVDWFMNIPMFAWLTKTIILLASNWDAIWASIGQTFEDVWNGIGDFFIGVANWVLDGIEAFINGAVDLLNGILAPINAVSGAIADVTGIGIRVPLLPYVDIPGLWEGGNILRSGSVLVGERGPEILNLPRGASVEPLDGGRGHAAQDNGGPVDLSPRSIKELAIQLGDVVERRTELMIRAGLI